MNKKIVWLAGIFAVQAVLALAFWLGGRADSGQWESEALLRFDKTSLDKLVISDEKDKVTLTKLDDTWVLSDANNLAVNQSKLDTLIDSLAQLKTTWPVASSKSSLQRFEVADDKFQKKVEAFDKGKSIGHLLVGTSPGFKKSHVRVADDDNVYALPINSYDLPVTVDDWLDKSLLALKNVLTIEGADFELSKNGEQWTFVEANTVEAAAAVDQQKAKDLAQAISTLTVTGPKLDAPEFSGDALATIDVSGDLDVRYQLLNSDDSYFIKRSDIESVFVVSKYDYDQLAEPDKSALTLVEEEESTEENENAEADDNSPQAEQVD